MKNKNRSIITILILGSIMIIIPVNSNVMVNQITAVKVGLLTPQTGNLSIYSPGFEQAAQLAIDNLNNDPVINTSYQFELLIYDTGTNETQAAIAMQGAVDDGVHFVIGPAASGNILAAAPIAVANQIPIIGYSSTSPEISTFDDHSNPLDHGYLWRTVSSDARHGHGMASLAFDGNYKNMAILSVDQIWGTALRDIIKSDFEKFGGAIVYSETFPQGITDFTSRIDDLLASSPDIITLPGFKEEIEYIVNELHTRNSTIPIISIDYGLNHIVEGPLEVWEDKIVISISVRDTVTGQNFRDAYQVKYSIGENDIFIEHTYDAVYTGALAISTIESVSGPEIIAALSNIKFEGASGPIEFDSNGDSVSALYQCYEIREGTFEKIATWDNENGLKYSDNDFMDRWRSTGTTVTVDVLLETTVTNIENPLPLPVFPIFTGIMTTILITNKKRKR